MTAGASAGAANTGELAKIASFMKNKENTDKISSVFEGLGAFGNAKNQADNDKITAEAYKAYQAYLNDVISQMANALEQRADKYDTKLQNQFSEAEPQYQQEANTQLAELQPLIQDIANESSEANRQNRREIEATLARQGVRGGQAAILENRALGENKRDMQRDINQLVYNDAANRQNSRLNYYSQKALTPWSTMSSAYGNSMVGANNALSNAQGGVYQTAYNRAMQNYINTQNQQKKKGFNWGGAAGGAASGAATGASVGGPWGAAIGGVAGGLLGGFSK